MDVRKQAGAPTGCPVENFNATLPGPHDRHGATHGQQWMALQLHKVAGSSPISNSRDLQFQRVPVCAMAGIAEHFGMQLKNVRASHAAPLS